MPQIGPLEIMTVAVLALVVFGPQRLPEIARNIGKAINEVRRVTQEMRSEVASGFKDEDSPALADEDDPPEPAKEKPAGPDSEER